MLRTTLRSDSLRIYLWVSADPADSQLLAWSSLRDWPVAFYIDITITGLEEFEIEFGSESRDHQVEQKLPRYITDSCENLY
jgi:hypothetical protein